MECKKCGAPNQEGATFCVECGERIDGKRVCGACGQLNEETNRYCMRCGARIDGKKVCLNCGEAYEGEVCPVCGYGKEKKEAEEIAEQASLEKAQKQERKARAGKLCELISGAAMMLGVLLSLIFVFFIGASNVFEIGGENASGSRNIFYFFGDYYKEVKNMDLTELEITEALKALISDQMTLYGVFGTVLSALTILCVVSFAVVAIVKYVLGLVNGTENKSYGWAIACVLSFLVGAAVFDAYVCEAVLFQFDLDKLEAIGADLSDLEILGIDLSKIDIWTSPNAATIVGIVLTSVTVAAGVVLRMVNKGKALWTSRNVANVVCSFIGIAFAGALLAFAQYSTVLLKFDVEYLELEIESGYMVFSTGCNIAFSWFTTEEVEVYERFMEILRRLNAYDTVSQICMIAVAVFAALSLKANVCGATGERKSGLLWAIAAMAASAFLLIFTVFIHISFEDILLLLANASSTELENDIIKANYAMPICAAACSVLLFVISVVRIGMIQRLELKETKGILLDKIN